MRPPSWLAAYQGDLFAFPHSALPRAEVQGFRQVTQDEFAAFGRELKIRTVTTVEQRGGLSAVQVATARAPIIGASAAAVLGLVALVAWRWARRRARHSRTAAADRPGPLR